MAHLGLISPAVRGLLLYGALALTAAALVVWYARDAPATLPGATALGGALHTVRRRLARAAPWIVVTLGTATAVGVYAESREVVLVTDEGAHPAARRMYELGGADEPSPGISVINASTHEVRVVTVPYRAMSAVAPRRIAPGERARFASIDHVGPDDHPPAILVSPPDVLTDAHRWLTWD